MANFESVTGVAFDGLFAGSEIPVLTANVTFKSGVTVKRGQLVSLDAGKGIATASGKVAVFVAAEDVDASDADTVGTVYTSGYFNREALITASGDTVTAHEQELRDKSIFLSSIK